MAAAMASLADNEKPDLVAAMMTASDRVDQLEKFEKSEEGLTTAKKKARIQKNLEIAEETYEEAN